MNNKGQKKSIQCHRCFAKGEQPHSEKLKGESLKYAESKHSLAEHVIGRCYRMCLKKFSKVYIRFRNLYMVVGELDKPD